MSQLYHQPMRGCIKYHKSCDEFAASDKGRSMKRGMMADVARVKIEVERGREINQKRDSGIPLLSRI